MSDVLPAVGLSEPLFTGANDTPICLATIAGGLTRVTARGGTELMLRPRAPGRPSLNQGELHVWCGFVPGLLGELASFVAVMSDEERTRRERYHREADSQRFTVARGMLRRLLGEYLERAPEEISFTFGRDGKPMLDDSLEFNVSHSGDLVLVVVASGDPVGVDVEQISARVDSLALAARFFHPDEHEHLLHLHGQDRDRAFYRMWTRKEACLKATGTGLRGLSGRAPLSGDGNGQDAGVRLVELSVHRDYCAAVATAGRE